MFNIFFILFAFQFCTNPSTSKKEPKTNKSVSDFRPLTDHEKKEYKERLEVLYDSLLLKKGFNGSILIAKNGEILLEDYRGVFNFKSKEPIDTNSKFHIASVSKTLTGMTILKMQEDNKLSLEDTLQKFFPKFPYPGVTVRMLLNHRSGLPNYVYFLAKDPVWSKKWINNNDILNYMVEKKPKLERGPDKGFQYCNTNYALLALIIEKISGTSFPVYMQENVFKPLGMNNTYVFSRKDSMNYTPSYKYNNVPYGIEPLDFVYGDKNVYTTVRDLFKWDKALYSNSFISENTYNEAIKPTSFEKKGTHHYGLGWRMLVKPEATIVYHNGWWHGNNASFTRLTADTATIIILGNKYNRAIYSGVKFGVAFNNGSTDQHTEE